MFSIIILIAAVSLDALSFGLAQGFKKNNLSIFNCFIMTILSTILFSVPLILSPLVFKYLNESFCNIFNGLVLILLGIYYTLSFFISKKRKINDKNEKINNLCLKFCILSTFPISLDAMFTAFINGYTIKNPLVPILIFFLFTFFSLFIPNKIAFRFSRKILLNLNWLSGLIFIIIGILKTFGI